MNAEYNRLKTFDNWPSNAPVSAEKLAKAGFYYTKQDQKVKCFSCQIELGDWNYGDQAMAQHKLYSSNCLFVVNPFQAGNVTYNSNTTPSSTVVVPNQECLQDEAARLRTFTAWPKSQIVSPQSLAKAGFYSLNFHDYTKCAFCDVVLVCWEPGDDPDEEHRRCSMNCPFVQSVVNARSTNTEQYINSNLRLLERHNLEDLGIHKHKLPKHPHFTTFEARLQTYQHWPAHVPQKPEDLASAGFYYEGVNDRVRCFHCDGGLNHWDPHDEPWSQHGHWFPECSFMQLTKGIKFIKECTPVQQARAPPQSGFRNSSRVLVSDQMLQPYLDTEQVRLALSIGIQVARIKLAIKDKLQQTGVGFTTSDELIEAALNIPIGDDDDERSDSGDSRLSEAVWHLLSDAIQSAVDNKKQSESVPPTKKEGPQETAKLSLEEENRLLKDASLCKICMDAEVGIVLLPCGHLSTCVQCAPNLKDCPVCRSPIKGTVRTFLS